MDISSILKASDSNESPISPPPNLQQPLHSRSSSIPALTATAQPPQLRYPYPPPPPPPLPPLPPPRLYPEPRQLTDPAVAGVPGGYRPVPGLAPAPPGFGSHGPAIRPPPPKRPMPPHAAETPAKKQSRWSAEEDALIVELRGGGMKWEEISKRLRGRSPISLRLRYQSYLERSTANAQGPNNLNQIGTDYSVKRGHPRTDAIFRQGVADLSGALDEREHWEKMYREIEAQLLKAQEDLRHFRPLEARCTMLSDQNSKLEEENKILAKQRDAFAEENKGLRKELAQVITAGPKIQEENDALRGALREALTLALREALRDTVSRLRFDNSASTIESAEELKMRFAILLRRS